MSFLIDDEKLLEKGTAIWSKIEDLKNIGLNALLVYGDRYIKTKTRTYDDKVYTNFRDLNVPEDDTECKSFTVMLCLNISDITIITVENNGHCFISHNISKSEAINLLKNSALEYRGFICLKFQSVQDNFFYFFV